MAALVDGAARPGGLVMARALRKHAGDGAFCTFCNAWKETVPGACPQCGLDQRPCGCLFRNGTRKITCLSHLDGYVPAPVASLPLPAVFLWGSALGFGLGFLLAMLIT